MRYFVHLAYSGTNYNGWQRQINTEITVQQTIETHFSRILKSHTIVNGCGRTDAGVHASQFFLHFDHPDFIPAGFVERANYNLPDDITVFELIEVKENAHCRYDAKVRQYDYFIHFQSDPFLNPYSTLLIDPNLDLGLLEECFEILLNHKDYYNMCRQPDKHKTTLCQIQSVSVENSQSNMTLKISITANRFLKGMIRILVAKSLDVAYRKISLSEFQAYLDGSIPRTHKNVAPAQGLYLSKINYPYLEVNNSSLLYTLLNRTFE